MKFGNRQAALVFGTSVLSVALLGGMAAAAFQPVDMQALAHRERVEKTKPPLPKLEEILDKLVVDGKITATQREAILAAVKQFTDKVEEKRPGSSWKGHLEGYLKTAATFLGMTMKDLLAALHDGKSLAEVATAQNKTRDALITAISAQANAKVDEALAANRMTAEQAAKAKAEIAERAGKIVDAKRDEDEDKDRKHDKDRQDKDKHGRHDKDKKEKKDKEEDKKGRHESKLRFDAHSLLGDTFRSAVAYIGQPETAVADQLRAGKTLAEVAIASGKTRGGLVSAISAPALAKIDDLRNQAKLTDEQATKAKAQVAEAVAKLVDAKAKVRTSVTPSRSRR